MEFDIKKLKERQTKIRNFCIIAHIDHGKTTLSDRILEICDSVESREMQEQRSLSLWEDWTPPQHQPWTKQ